MKVRRQLPKDMRVDTLAELPPPKKLAVVRIVDIE